MRIANLAGRATIVTDAGLIDLATAAGEFMANVMASAAQWERRIIGQRTRDALAVSAVAASQSTAAAVKRADAISGDADRRAAALRPSDIWARATG